MMRGIGILGLLAITLSNDEELCTSVMHRRNVPQGPDLFGSILKIKQMLEFASVSVTMHLLALSEFAE
jgi:hypothetical protein